MATTALLQLIFIFFIIISIFSTQVCSISTSECEVESDNSCINKNRALSLKIVAIFSILVASVIGVTLPLVTHSFRIFSPERSLFVIIKAFAAGIILGTGFMHVLPDSFDMLNSSCLSENPWHNFPFTGFVAMLSATFTLMIDSLATSFYSEKTSVDIKLEDQFTARDIEIAVRPIAGHFHGHHHEHQGAKEGVEKSQLIRYRVIAMVLELGIVVHSVVIGISLGASNNTCTIKPLLIAVCFHQMFEGIGLGGSILQAEYKTLKKTIMVFFFAMTNPFGIALGIALSKMYKENSPSSLITVGLLNASSAGLLIYMALVDLLAADFMGLKLQGSIRLQIKAFAAVILGAGVMSLLANWT